MGDNRPIAIIDSGLGGLSIAQAIWPLLPHESTLYLADHLFFPYGEKDELTINHRLIPLINFCLTKNCKLVVIACNTITASSISFLRSIYPLPFIGTEPAIKPAIRANFKENIVVLATQATIAKLHLSASIQAIACRDLAPAIEKYGADPRRLTPVVKKYLSLIKSPYSAIVLGCTHYLLIKNLIKSLLPPNVVIIEPSQAIARQTQAVLTKKNLLAVNAKASRVFYTTANRRSVSLIASKLLKSRIIFTSCSL
ncbi:MAG: glutamate racemase [Candidatus Beckwithbacteria bacterium]|nr:glutamate racemase [Candidatus Beckwithbacteria bacterium]